MQSVNTKLHHSISGVSGSLPVAHDESHTSLECQRSTLSCTHNTSTLFGQNTCCCIEVLVNSLKHFRLLGASHSLSLVYIDRVEHQWHVAELNDKLRIGCCTMETSLGNESFNGLCISSVGYSLTFVEYYRVGMGNGLILIVPQSYYEVVLSVKCSTVERSEHITILIVVAPVVVCLSVLWPVVDVV